MGPHPILLSAGHTQEPDSLGQTPRPGHTDQSCFLPRSSVPKTAKGLSNPLFHEGPSVPAKGGAPAATTHPSQPTRPMASRMTPKQLPRAVSSASHHPWAIPNPFQRGLELPRRGRSRLQGGQSENPHEPVTDQTWDLDVRLSASAGWTERC